MSENKTTREDILSTVDDFIDKINGVRKIMLGVSVSAIALAPFAIGLSIYLFTHPSFFLILETENEFGLFLSILLAGIIVVSGIWLATGIRQYRSLSSWNERYDRYLKKKEEIDSSISSKYNLNKD